MFVCVCVSVCLWVLCPQLAQYKSTANKSREAGQQELKFDFLRVVMAHPHYVRSTARLLVCGRRRPSAFVKTFWCAIALSCCVLFASCSGLVVVLVVTFTVSMLRVCVYVRE